MIDHHVGLCGINILDLTTVPPDCASHRSTHWNIQLLNPIKPIGRRDFLTATANPSGYISFTLHAHLPYVVNHGTWPHGIEWLHEAAAERGVELHWASAYEMFCAVEALTHGSRVIAASQEPAASGTRAR